MRNWGRGAFILTSVFLIQYSVFIAPRLPWHHRLRPRITRLRRALRGTQPLELRLRPATILPGFYACTRSRKGVTCHARDEGWLVGGEPCLAGDPGTVPI